MAINTTAIANLLRPGLAACFGMYPLYQPQWSEIFEKYDSDKAVEYEMEMKFLGLGQIRPEGAPTAMDTMGQRTVTSYTHKFVALSFAITKQAIEDNLYKTKFPQMAKALKNSLAQTKEILGASVINNGFSGNFPIGDGQPLFSTAHPIDNGTVANTFGVLTDLNEASLESMTIQIQKFKDVAGLTIQTKPMKLIVPPELQYTADRLLESSFRTNTANNDINAIYNVSAVPQGYRTNQYLTNSSAYYLLTDAPDSFKHYVRSPVETDVYADFATKNILASAEERYSFGVSNWRGAFGGRGA